MKTLLKKNGGQFAVSLLIFLAFTFVSCQKELTNSSMQSSTVDQQNASNESYLTQTLFIKSNGANLNVPGTFNPWLAGMPDGTSAGAGDVAPDQSPVLVSIRPCDAWIEVSNASGTVSNCECNLVGPEGDNYLQGHGAQLGKSSFIAPINSLVGVFLDDNIPMGKPPKPLDFSTQKSRDYLALHPDLKQVFFIGNGKTSGGIQQKIFIPEGGTRLFLGTTDGIEWNNNIGFFNLTLKRFSK